MTFQFPDTVKLAQTPTPIEKLQRTTQFLEGPQVYIKRDDLTGILMTGNKVRKLEFLLAEAISQQCDTIITCGGYQSNHARTTAVAAARLGLRCRLVLRNSVTAPPDGNLFIDRLVGAEVQYISPEEYERVDGIMLEVADEVKEKGRRPYVIPEGGSNELGTLGYVKTAQEISKQLKSLKRRIDHIVVPVGSGGTYAGLLLGKFLFDLPAKVHGIIVCDDKDFFIAKVRSLINKIKIMFQLDFPIDAQDISIIDGYVGKGYGLSSQKEIEMIKQVARCDGIILDPVYTGKAMYGVAEEIKKERFQPDENLLFIHTGGIFGIFPKRGLFF